MFDRLRICLLHPRFIGKFIIDKIWKVIVLYIILIAILGVLLFSLYKGYSNLPQTEESQITNVIMRDDTADLTFNNKVLSGTAKKYIYSFDDNDLGIYFLDDVSERTETFIIIFNSDNYEVYLGNKLLEKVNYSTLNINDFKIDGSNDNTSRIALGTLISMAFNAYNNSLAASNTFFNLFEILGTLLFIFLITFLITYNINSTIKGKFRFSLLLHCGIPYLVIYILAYMLNISFLQYVAMLIPIIYFFISLKSIVKVEARKQ